MNKCKYLCTVVKDLDWPSKVYHSDAETCSALVLLTNSDAIVCFDSADPSWFIVDLLHGILSDSGASPAILTTLTRNLPQPFLYSQSTQGISAQRIPAYPAF